MTPALGHDGGRDRGDEQRGRDNAGPAVALRGAPTPDGPRGGWGVGGAAYLGDPGLACAVTFTFRTFLSNYHASRVYLHRAAHKTLAADTPDERVHQHDRTTS
ncbi:hypothetical protein F4778DRAFT_364123 [Xylariomycetidae sp. FL2044]|nr:hypothetical protein F4778DRAFT_364123 [Xylariomycetidae sp. FL2044]